MKNYYFSIAFSFCTLSYSQTMGKLSYFPLNHVKLSPSIFETAMQTDKTYVMAMDPDRLLAPYLKEAGLQPKAHNYPNWENTGLDGHIGGHYLSALSLLYASTGDKVIKQRLDYMIGELNRCQQQSADGYLSGIPNGKAIWSDIEAGHIKASGFGLNDRWVPLYNIHKIYSGLRDAYWFADSQVAKKMLIKLTDWMDRLTSKLSDAQLQDMLRSEHGGLNEVFADVYDLTKDKKYLKLAKRFSHHAILDPLLNQKDELTGLHANTQIPKVIGYKRIADLDNNNQWSDAADYFWHQVTEKRSTIIGGNSVVEHFNPTHDFNHMLKSVEGPETCNTYNMLKLSKELFATNPSSYYINYYEKALYNHILSTQNNDKGGFVYFTPMRPGHYRVYSQPETSFWCCVGSGIENHAKYGEMIYAHNDHDLYVNLFIPSQVNWTEKGAVISQTNNFPYAPETKLVIENAGNSKFNIKFRAPDWTNYDDLKILINGKEVKFNIDDNGYILISKKWKKGDTIEMKMPMQLSTEQLPDQSDYFAFKYGPIVLAAKYGKDHQTGLFADDSRGGHIAQGSQIPMTEIPTILGPKDEVINHVTAINTDNLTFNISGLYPESKFEKGLQLVPFYSINAERYILYFPQADQDKIEEVQRKKADDDAIYNALEKITVDKIKLGEQQPESDHFFLSEKSNAGYMEDLHYREAEGWFAYTLKNLDKKAKYIAIKYFDNDKNRILNVEVNGKTITSKKLEGKTGLTVQSILIQLPKPELTKDQLYIKFYGTETFMTPKILEIRLLNQ